MPNPRVIAPQVFQTTPDTASMNDMLKLAGQGLQSLAAENTKLHRRLVEEQLAKQSSDREIELFKVAHDLARLGHFREHHIPAKVSQWVSEKKDPAFIRQLYAVGGDRSSAENVKSSSARLDGPSNSVSSSSQVPGSTGKNSWTTFLEGFSEIVSGD